MPYMDPLRLQSDKSFKICQYFFSRILASWQRLQLFLFLSTGVSIWFFSQWWLFAGMLLFALWWSKFYFFHWYSWWWVHLWCSWTWYTDREVYQLQNSEYDWSIKWTVQLCRSTSHRILAAQNTYWLHSSRAGMNDMYWQDEVDQISLFWLYNLWFLLLTCQYQHLFIWEAHRLK